MILCSKLNKIYLLRKRAVMATSDQAQFAPNSAAARDLAYYLHPYTNIKAHEESGPLIINSGKGVFVYDDQGKEYIEGMAGLLDMGKSVWPKRLMTNFLKCHTLKGLHTAQTKLQLI